MAERAPATTVDDLRWTAVSAVDPCPLCAAPGDCGVAAFRGGVAVHCRRVVSRWPMAQGGWLHRMPADGAAEDPSHASDGATCAFPMPFRRDAGARSPLSADSAAARAPETGPPAIETVLGAFGTRRLAERAVADLLAAGFGPGELSVLGRHGETIDVTPEHGTVTAAGVGAAVGGFGSVALGLVGAAVPGIGPVIALGPFSAALSAMGGSLADGLTGFFTAHGVPASDAARYAERVGAGAYVVAVHTDDGPRAESILATAGAEAPIRHTSGAGAQANL